jgi:pyruvate/2-oxoglutarate dehydrogenase complex dihydrolipoamide dehydrogenase (E3) component
MRLTSITNNRHLIIVGGGSAAFSAINEAKSLGIKVTMINDR